MATAIEWAKLLFANSKVIVTMWGLLLVSLGYNVYGLIETTEVEKEVVEEVVLVKKEPINHPAKKLMADHLEEYH